MKRNRIENNQTHLTNGTRSVQEYTEQHYLPAAAAYERRAAQHGALGKQIVDWHLDLDTKWAGVRFGDSRVENQSTQHVFEIQLYLGDLSTDGVQVELYADGVNGSGPVRQIMTPIRSLAGAVNGYAYRASVP